MVSYAIAATGTGGHVFPALAISQALEARDDNVVWFGVSGALESKFAKVHVPLAVGPVVGGSNKVKKIIALFKSIPKVCSELRKHKVQKVIVFGGYISIPVGIAAFILGLDLYIQEQNALAGRANRLLYPFARKVFTAYPRVFGGEKVFITGNPLRFNKSWKVPNNILVLGGSLGSSSLYAKILDFAAMLPDYKFRIMSGVVNFPTISDLNNVEVLAFSDAMPAIYDWADVVIARAGALTISECDEFGLPMFLVPLPNSADNHQVFNARFSGKAMMVNEKFLDIDVLSNWLANGPKSSVELMLDQV